MGDLISLDLKTIVQEHGLEMSLVLVSIILFAALLCFFYMYWKKRQEDLVEHRGFIEMMPSLISTLGVLGTFAGISLGLYYFDSDINQITQSIQMLLGGLKTAFFTSLAGMVGSLILSWYVNRLYDKQTSGISDSEMAAGLVVKSLQDQQQLLSQQIEAQKAFYSALQSNMRTLLQYMVAQNASIPTMDASLKSLSNSSNAISESIENIKSNVVKSTETAVSIFNRIEDLGKDLGLMIESSNVMRTIVTAELPEIRDVGTQGILRTQQIVENTNALLAKTDSMLASIGNIEERETVIKDKLVEQAGFVGEISTHTEALVSGQDEISKHVSKFGETLHGEVVEIEDKMDDVNKLLKAKFEEFAELLRKSNTEALVEVMKKVTLEFQKQMTALINNLVQENFEQLNKSVERLNTWQQENKTMIQSLTSQYKQMAQNFENTSTSLTKVDEDTRKLVSEGGKLHQLVNLLNKVIVEDEKFIKISGDLQKTADLTKTNYEQFDAATKSLNEWVRKQRRFVDGVMVLIEKLDEINKIKDYGDQFWRETKASMNEGVGIIKDGTDSLNQQVTTLNSQFYSRLSTTLTELDNCIQAFADAARNRNQH